jgi:hypothetical protein
VEGEPKAGKAFGAREIAFQRFLKTHQRRIEPSAAKVDLAKAVQGVKAVRVMLEAFGVKSFGLDEFAFLERPPGAPQRARRICVIVVHETVAHTESDRRLRTVERRATVNSG